MPAISGMPEPEQVVEDLALRAISASSLRASDSEALVERAEQAAVDQHHARQVR